MSALRHALARRPSESTGGQFLYLQSRRPHNNTQDLKSTGTLQAVSPDTVISNTLTGTAEFGFLLQLSNLLNVHV